LASLANRSEAPIGLLIAVVAAPWRSKEVACFVKIGGREVRARKIWPSRGTWRHAQAILVTPHQRDTTVDSTLDRRIASCQSFRQLLEGLRHPDPNHRIASIRSLVAIRNGNAVERAKIIDALLDLLSDHRPDEYPYSGFMCDEEEPAVLVCNEAALALVSAGYASTMQAVFEKARAASFAVSPTQAVDCISQDATSAGRCDAERSITIELSAES
jgi:hypothetical protein